MQLTRRDALIALFGGSAAAGFGGAVTALTDGTLDTALEPSHVDRLEAIATVLYPSAVEAGPEFLATYVGGRIGDNPDYRDGMVGALDDVAAASQRRHGRKITALDESTVDRLLRAIGVDTAYPVPDGTVPERVRYYIVNDLLYALYTSPVGGRLVGYENPDGFPGGLDAYQQGPDT